MKALSIPFTAARAERSSGSGPRASTSARGQIGGLTFPYRPLAFSMSASRCPIVTSRLKSISGKVRAAARAASIAFAEELFHTSWLKRVAPGPPFHVGCQTLSRRTE